MKETVISKRETSGLTFLLTLFLLLGGPVITFPFGDAESTEDLALTADLGGGLELDVSGVVLMPEIRYSVGVTDFLSDDFQVGDVSVQPSDDNRRLSKVMLRHASPERVVLISTAAAGPAAVSSP